MSAMRGALNPPRRRRAQGKGFAGERSARDTIDITSIKAHPT
jgi:hypothetical protein